MSQQQGAIEHDVNDQVSMLTRQLNNQLQTINRQVVNQLEIITSISNQIGAINDQLMNQLQVLGQLSTQLALINNIDRRSDLDNQQTADSSNSLICRTFFSLLIACSSFSFFHDCITRINAPPKHIITQF